MKLKTASDVNALWNAATAAAALGTAIETGLLWLLAKKPLSAQDIARTLGIPGKRGYYWVQLLENIGIYWIVRRYALGAWVLGAAVVSHWVLDLVVHRPDLPLYPGGRSRLGLGLWNSVPATLVVEFGLLALGVGLYLSTTTARDSVGRYAFWTFVASLVVLYLAASFGPPPPNVRALAIIGLGAWLWVLWGYWIDRHREPGRIMRIAR